MKKNIIYIAAMAMLTAACSNEDDTFLSGFENNGVGNTKMITETITATSGDDATRAAIAADAKFSWSAGDQIAVHVSDGNTIQPRLSLLAETTLPTSLLPCPKESCAMLSLSIPPLSWLNRLRTTVRVARLSTSPFLAAMPLTR